MPTRTAGADGSLGRGVGAGCEERPAKQNFTQEKRIHRVFEMIIKNVLFICKPRKLVLTEKNEISHYEEDKSIMNNNSSGGNSSNFKNSNLKSLKNNFSKIKF